MLAVCLAADAPALAQGGNSDEARREGWQKVADIFAALSVKPGAVVADVGCGDGFFTVRLARAVGPDGRVYAVDVDDRVLDRLKRRLSDEGLRNVTVLKGSADDPKLPEKALDAALIVNAYHEMTQPDAMLSSIERALKADGRLVIVEPITDSKRARSRAEQTKDHEIAPELVLGEARTAGFRVVALEDPFLARERDAEWLIVLKPGGTRATAAPVAAPAAETPADRELSDPDLRIPQDAFIELQRSGRVTVVDVRDEESFAAGHIPGALLAPLSSVEHAIEQLERLGKPVVTYCS